MGMACAVSIETFGLDRGGPRWQNDVNDIRGWSKSYKFQKAYSLHNAGYLIYAEGREGGFFANVHIQWNVMDAPAIRARILNEKIATKGEWNLCIFLLILENRRILQFPVTLTYKRLDPYAVRLF